MKFDFLVFKTGKRITTITTRTAVTADEVPRPDPSRPGPLRPGPSLAGLSQPGPLRPSPSQTRMPLCNLPSFNEVMPRNRFLQISRFLHVNDEAAGNPNNDKLYKVREFIDRLNRNFGDKYNMGCQISINDESLIPFKGRLSYRQFMPSKRARFGIKCWVLADARNSFVSHFIVYTGHDANANTGIPLSTRVVRQLVEGYVDLNHQLYVDNFYTSPALFNWLLERMIYACGTVRKGRVGFPKTIYFPRGRHERGTASYLSRGDLLSQSWFDSKEVYF